jgi:Right handed beta helix region
MPKSKRIVGVAVPAASGFIMTALLLILLGALSATAQATPLSAPTGIVRYVAPTGNDAANDCTASGLPCQSPQHALDVALAGDEIRVAAGTYTSTGGTVASISQTVTLKGGWNSLFSQNDPLNNPTILDGQALQPVILIVSPITLSAAAHISPTIEGFIITHGHGLHAACLPGDPVVAECGAGIASSYANPLILNNVIVENHTNFDGGGIQANGNNGTLVISGNKILSNTAEVAGGAIYIAANNVLISGNTIAYNHALSSTAGRGAGVRVDPQNAWVTITQNDVYANVTAWGGGSGLDLSAPGVVDGNLLHQNQTTEWGGALLLADAGQPKSAANNVIYDNGGSGIQAIDFAGTVALVNNTVVGNHNVAHSGAIGILVYFAITPTVPVTATVVNNMLVGNESCGLDIFRATGFISNHNDVFGNTLNFCESANSAGNLSANPLFVNAAAGNYRLSGGSPAINAGTNAGAPATDKDGTLRPQAFVVDIGAYEFIFDHTLFMPLVKR